jgi:hypothetical protein
MMKLLLIMLLVGENGQLGVGQKLICVILSMILTENKDRAL